MEEFLRVIGSKVFSTELAAALGGLVLAFGIDLAAFGWRGSSLKRLLVKPSRSAKFDLILAAIYGARLQLVLAAVFSVGLVDLLPRLVRSYVHTELLAYLGPPLVQALAYVLFYDFIWYWKHRLAHKLTWWWEIHKVHHSATEFNLITSNRVHPFDEALTRMLLCLPLAFFGAPAETYPLVFVLLQTHLFLVHSMLPWTFGWVGRWLIVSPVAHRIHHSPEAVHFGCNFGGITPLWDRLFGTWYAGDRLNESVGCDDNAYNQSPAPVELWVAYKASVTDLGRTAADAVRREKKSA